MASMAMQCSSSTKHCIMATAYLGLGTNIGNRKENLTRAIEALSLALGPYTALSAFIETAPWGFESENGFLNCAVAYEQNWRPRNCSTSPKGLSAGLAAQQNPRAAHITTA